MAIRIVQLGSERTPGEGLRIGTVRRPPRGVPKGQYSHRNYFDVWLPQLAPSEAIMNEVRSTADHQRGWRRFQRRYGAEMRRPDNARLLGMLAALSHQANFSVGCYCDDETRCHRSLLAGLLRRHGARIASDT